MDIFRNICPRNCYCACGILSYVDDGRLVKVNGDKKHGFSRGNLCSKGYSYVQKVYSPERMLYPMYQYPRCSGNWHRITWDHALSLISEKFLELKSRYNSFQPICLNKQSGNLGMLHFAFNGLFNSLGATVIEGNSCMSAGLDAYLYTYGEMPKPDPEDMVHSKVIIIWGANPAWTAVHQMYFVKLAQERGAKLIVIDPVYTATAVQADIYLQPRAATDGILALGMAKFIVEQGYYEQEFLKKHVTGYEQFFEYLNSISYEDIENETGLPKKAWQEAAAVYAQNRPGSIWLGMGLQRYSNGGQNFRAILSLTAFLPNICQKGGGTYYPNLSHWDLFSYYTNDGYRKENNVIRKVNINNFAGELAGAKDPPIKALWVAGRDLFQDADIVNLETALSSLELIVQVDHVLNRTSKYTDLFLPTTTHFEEWDIVASYWHNWIGLNQPAIQPRGECKSDLNIAQDVAKKLNESSSGCCHFPMHKSEEDWIEKEFTPDLIKALGITNYKDLLDGPRKLKTKDAWAQLKFNTSSGRIELLSQRAAEDGLPELPVYKKPLDPPSQYPYRLITPHFVSGINSQFACLSWLAWGIEEPKLRMHPQVAADLNANAGDLVRVYNSNGEITLPIELTYSVPKEVLLTYEGWFKEEKKAINTLVNGGPCDMGRKSSGWPGIAFYDTFVNVCLA